MSIFKTPEEINLTNLQQTAFAKLKQYREATALTLQVPSFFRPLSKLTKFGKKITVTVFSFILALSIS